jgi:hypothetical protein
VRTAEGTDGRAAEERTEEMDEVTAEEVTEVTAEEVTEAAAKTAVARWSRLASLVPRRTGKRRPDPRDGEAVPRGNSVGRVARLLHWDFQTPE